MAIYYVTMESECHICQGTGVIQHPLWGLYWEKTDGLPSVEDDMEWFRQQGCSVYQPRDLPNEEIPCRDCQGTGKRREESPLQTAIAEILGLDVQ